MMVRDRDEDGQPLNERFNLARRTERDIDELLGLCKGLAADGRVNSGEAEFLSEWLKLNAVAKDEWPGDILFARVQHMLQDGRLDLAEERELLDLLVKVTGGNASKLNASSLTTGLPLSTPAPALDFGNRHFCFTGKFLLGPRARCEEAVVSRGGRVQDSITNRLNFLVIGVVGSRDWVHSSYGRKIEKAVEIRSNGAALAIVSEEHFIHALDRRP